MPCSARRPSPSTYATEQAQSLSSKHIFEVAKAIDDAHVNGYKLAQQTIARELLAGMEPGQLLTTLMESS